MGRTLHANGLFTMRWVRVREARLFELPGSTGRCGGRRDFRKEIADPRWSVGSTGKGMAPPGRPASLRRKSGFFSALEGRCVGRAPSREVARKDLGGLETKK